MLTVYHEHFEIEITSFINQQGNTSYMLDVFDYSHSGSGKFAYRFIRYQWGGGSNYLLCADSDGWCFPYAVRIKDLLNGFNWSCVRRAIRDRARMHNTWFSEAMRYGK